MFPGRGNRCPGTFDPGTGGGKVVAGLIELLPGDQAPLMHGFNTLKALSRIRQCRFSLLQPGLGLAQSGSLLAVLQLDNQVPGGHGIINVERQALDGATGLRGNSTLLYGLNNAIEVHSLMQFASLGDRCCHRLGRRRLLCLRRWGQQAQSDHQSCSSHSPHEALREIVLVIT